MINVKTLLSSSNCSSSQKTTTSSTWSAFLTYFLFPIGVILIVSNSDGLFGFNETSVLETPLTSEKDYANDANAEDERPSTSPSMIPIGDQNEKYDSKKKSPTSVSNSQFKSEVDAALERKMKKRRQTKEQSQQLGGDADIQQRRSRQNGQKRPPNSPQSDPRYLEMETKIAELRSVYEDSRGEPDEYMSALRFADYLRHRDTTIHDGGTYQMEAIRVYHEAASTIEQLWRDQVANGEDTQQLKRVPESSDSPPSLLTTYSGLNREIFLDHGSKSIEGSLCATYTGLGKVYFMSNMFERAVQSYEECLAYDHDYLDALTYRAQCLIILGKYEEAGRDYLRVLEIDHDRIFIDSVTGLAKVLTAKEDAVPGGWNALIPLLERELPRHEEAHRLSKTSQNPAGIKHYSDSLKRIHHALFLYHDVKTKDISLAWTHLSKGNSYKISTVAPFNASIEKDRVLKLKQVFVPDFFPVGIGSQTRTPIFIIGFVRSGSTLLERILDAHPLIVGTGEDSVFNGRLDFIRNEIVRASMSGELRALHVAVKGLADDVVADMRKRWEMIDANTRTDLEDADMMDEISSEHEEEQEKPRPTRFTDKMLTNYMNVGFIHLLFPKALILHVAREPMDTIFSAYKHDFPSGTLDYTSEFKGLAQLYHSYRDVMEHWDKVLPGRVTHIRYEDLVTDFPNVAGKILEAAGVPWDASVLDFHKKKHAVNTLSTTQVRKGVYTHHLKGWKRYEDHLGPLLKLVGSRVKYDLQTTLPGYTQANDMDDS